LTFSPALKRALFKANYLAAKRSQLASLRIASINIIMQVEIVVGARLCSAPIAASFLRSMQIRQFQEQKLIAVIFWQNID
jgi:hypothetical protein